MYVYVVQLMELLCRVISRQLFYLVGNTNSIIISGCRKLKFRKYMYKHEFKIHTLNYYISI